MFEAAAQIASGTLKEELRSFQIRRFGPRTIYVAVFETMLPGTLFFRELLPVQVALSFRNEPAGEAYRNAEFMKTFYDRVAVCLWMSDCWMTNNVSKATLA